MGKDDLGFFRSCRAVIEALLLFDICYRGIIIQWFPTNELPKAVQCRAV